MSDIAEHLQSLVDEPREALDVEVKRWLDLSDKPGQATLAKAAIALANHGGGYVVLGFAEQPDGSFVSCDLRPESLEGFSQDAIARIIVAYAEPSFQVVVKHIARRDSDVRHPVIVVPGSHRTPILAKKGSPDQKTLVTGRAYIRRPTPESAEPSNAMEWRDLLDRCIRAGRDSLLDAIRDVLDGSSGASTESTPSSAERLSEWTKAGWERWQSLAPKSAKDEPVDPPGTYTVAYQLEGPVAPKSPAELLDVLRGIRGYTGWRPWVVLTREEFKPYVFDGMLECSIGANTTRRVVDPARADFWRVNDAGQALLIRGFQEDASEKTEAGKAFDLTLPIWRVGECLLHAAEFGSRMTTESHPINFTFSWRGLAGRELVALEGRHLLFDGLRARQDCFSRSLQIESGLIADQLPELIYEFLKPLYALFDMFELPKALVDGEVQRLRTR